MAESFFTAGEVDTYWKGVRVLCLLPGAGIEKAHFGYPELFCDRGKLMDISVSRDSNQFKAI